jgi:hypothetical protein
MSWTRYIARVGGEGKGRGVCRMCDGETWRNQFEEAGLDKRIILKCVFNKFVERTCTGLVSLIRGKWRAFVNVATKFSFSQEEEKFLRYLRGNVRVFFSKTKLFDQLVNYWLSYKLLRHWIWGPGGPGRHFVINKILPLHNFLLPPVGFRFVTSFTAS